MLGELDGYNGTISASGKIAHISQQAWIFPASIKQNILFGMPYNKVKFDKVVEACSLTKDLELLAYGQDTLVGEKGINLSGGQRARINM
jgi:ABC-type multidrug transport system fused ATPase/permease subunit